MAEAGYSNTPLAKKLGIKPRMTIAAVGYSEDYAELVGLLPEDVRLERYDTLPTHRGPELNILHFFTNSRHELFLALDRARSLIRQDGMIWVSWYKKAAKLPTEITEDTIRNAALPLGLVDVKVCAVDERWSGLKLVIRKELRVS